MQELHSADWDKIMIMNSNQVWAWKETVWVSLMVLTDNDLKSVRKITKAVSRNKW